jgi:hypothetical protein
VADRGRNLVLPHISLSGDYLTVVVAVFGIDQPVPLLLAGRRGG